MRRAQRLPRGVSKNDPRIYYYAETDAEAASKIAECKDDQGKLNLLLRRAAYHNDLLTAKAALEGGADPNSQNLLREGPMVSLCTKGSVEMLHLFLKHGASLGPDKFGVPPLYHCVNKERLELIAEMVKAGANVNALENHLLQTPLHRAVFCTSAAKFVKLLLDLGADPRRIDAAGHTPLEAAELARKHFGRRQPQVFKLLKEALKKWKNKPPPKKPRRRQKSASEKMADKYIETEVGETDLSDVRTKAIATPRNS
jgi:ankyrin repeat protein